MQELVFESMIVHILGLLDVSYLKTVNILKLDHVLFFLFLVLIDLVSGSRSDLRFEQICHLSCSTVVDAEVRQENVIVLLPVHRHLVHLVVKLIQNPNC